MKFFLTCIFFNFPLCSYSFSSPFLLTNFVVAIREGSEIPTEESSLISIERSHLEAAIQTNLKANDSENSVWRIRNHSNYFMGTTFSIGPNLFVTNFHVLRSMLKDESSIKDITLQQKGHSSHLTIKRIIAVSAFYDLVLLETEQSVTSYLNITENPIYPKGELFMPGYPQGDFKEMKKIGEVVDHGYHYTFSVNHTHLLGTSGSPVLNTEGQVVGVSSFHFLNILSIVKSKHLKELIAGDRGVNCSDIIHLTMCMKQEMEDLKRSAEQGDALAQYILAMMYNEEEAEKSLGLKFDWMKKSAEQGNIFAQYDLAVMYYNGKGIKKDRNLAFLWMKKSAEQNYAPAQYVLAMIYHNGWEIERNLDLAFYWIQKAVEQGHALAQDKLEYMTHYWGQDNELVFY